MTHRMIRAATVFAVLAAAAIWTQTTQAQRHVPSEDPLHPLVKYADSLVSLNDRCIVAGNKLSTTVRPTYVSNVPVGFCCTRCPGIFAGEPEKYLSMRELEVPCAVHPSRAAILIPAMRARINHEVYFFSGAEARDRFLENPLRYCGYLTDPVNQVRFRPDSTSPHTVFDERPYYFTSDSTLKSFEGSPENHANRAGA